MGLPIPSNLKEAAGGLLGGLGGGGSASSALGGLFGGGASGGSGGKNPFGGLFGKAEEAKKQQQSKTGKIAPQFATSKDAETQLLNYEPMLISDGDIDLCSTDWEAGASGSDITHIQNYVRAEFMRREKNFGMHYPEKMQDTNDRGTHASVKFGKDDFGKDKQGFLENEYVDTIYRGPKTAWARFVSNATTIENPDPTVPKHEGFVMHGVEAFGDNYGFSKDPSKTHKNVIGFDANGGTHTSNESDFKHRPPPGVMNVKVEYSGIATGERKTTIEFVCWSRSQLDYLQPYFFTVGVTALVEFGWNNFPRESLIDLKNIGSAGKFLTSSPEIANGSTSYILKQDGKLGDYQSTVNKRRKEEGRSTMFSKDDDVEGKIIRRPTGLIGLFQDGHVCHEQMKSGKGNYSFAIGMISNYSYSLRQDGGYDCSVELTSMAQVAKMMTNNATKAQSKEIASGEDGTRTSNFQQFIDKELDDIVSDLVDPALMGLTTLVDSYDQQTEDRDRINKLFKFYKQAFSPNSSESQNTYHAGTNDDKFISVYLLIQIIRVFFKRDVPNKLELFEFEIENSRCIAHPNIKSVDGNILLIPNAVAPRRNTKNSEQAGLIAGMASAKWDGSTDDSQKNKTFGFQVNQNQSAEAEMRSSVAQTGYAITKRDDLHCIITAPQLSCSGNADKKRTRAFPDFAPGTKGMSGRIRDLYINTKVIKDAVKNHKTIISMLDAIFKKMSTAAGDIWDFKVTPLDSNNSNETKLTIRDMKYYGNKTVETVKRENKAYIFRAHQKNSIVRNLDLDIQVPAELKSMVVYDSHDDAQVAFYQRKKQDRILKEVSGIKVIPGVVKEDTEEEEDDAENTNKEYFIVPFTWDTDGFDSTYDVQCVDINKDRMLESMTSDMIPENAVKGYNQPIDGCEMTITLDGIEGLRMLDAFNCTGIPTHWFMNGIWQITAINHTISNGDWETTINAILRPNSNESKK